jgi:hypothetical protein
MPCRIADVSVAAVRGSSGCRVWYLGLGSWVGGTGGAGGTAGLEGLRDWRDCGTGGLEDWRTGGMPGHSSHFPHRMPKLGIVFAGRGALISGLGGMCSLEGWILAKPNQARAPELLPCLPAGGRVGFSLLGFSFFLESHRCPCHVPAPADIVLARTLATVAQWQRSLRHQLNIDCVEWVELGVIVLVRLAHVSILMVHRNSAAVLDLCITYPSV